MIGGILNSHTLIRVLQRLEDDFITVKIQGDDREYIIDSVGHAKNYADAPSSHLCLLCRDGGQGEIRR